MREIVPEFERFIEESMAILGGRCAVAIVQGGEVVYEKGFGVKAIGGESGITPATQMMIGSIGKTMTTMLMAALVDEGRLQWETPVVHLLPDFAVADPELTRKLTVRDWSAFAPACPGAIWSWCSTRKC